MIILIVGVLLIIYSIVTKKFSVWVGMLFVLLIMGFQENCFTDYSEYKTQFTNGTLSYTVKEIEFSFVWLWLACSSIMSFHWFVLLTSFFQCLAMGMMIRDFAPTRYKYFAVLLVFFTFNLMLIRLTAMRQGYAVDVLLFAYFLLGNKKYIPSILVAAIAFGFHNSSIIAVPFFIFIWIVMLVRRNRKEEDISVAIGNNKKGMRLAIIAVICLISFYVLKYHIFSGIVNPFLMGLDAFSYEGYLNEFEDGGTISWWILLYHTVSVFVVTLYYANESSIFRKYLAFLVIVFLFLNVGIFGFGNLERTTLYFIVFTIVVFPNVADMIRKTYGKGMALGYVLFNMLYIMYFSVGNMLSTDYSNATGFASYSFSFLNW